MLTNRQLRNRELRAAGRRPIKSYFYHVQSCDVVEILLSEQDPEYVIRRKVRILSTAEHGWYTIVSGHDDHTGEYVEFQLFRDAPPDWGVVECVLLERPPRHSLLE